ncbi:hypothetical protein LTS07_007500 [Exophiala sideris]|uniref:SMP-30/Gluconolactonase/LRE-like region domain-containing protein n=1 Tax=Exophiala sideris TaxID=1016849 RepID=A0ABR0J355_9EURO|nr:hypothetical protein LTS07_007500 [Exophiala sideris]KAK5033694.1 hypothetical protein LTR13_006746 [Exophiala sideris]KAK5055517.1 hypothetical protein LTR69_008350 [Exophiala sideris]KAK5180101.1 hypothetical protein LTR44_007577 [Eurotiomycetes sp. CCFEE 6388]
MSSALAANITIYQHNVSFVPTPLPAPGPASNFDTIINQFNQLGRSTVWNLVKKIQFEGDNGEPEGMVNINEERYIVSGGLYTNKTVSYGNNTIINGTDRTPGAGYGYLAVFDGQGKRIAIATLTETGALEYHNGGIDYDGQVIWATIAQYRPNTTASIITVNPTTLEFQDLIHYTDHLGGIVHDIQNQSLSTLNWGARNATVWDLTAKRNAYPQFSQPKAVDCKFLGHSQTYNYRAVMMCSGVATYSNNVTVSAVAIVDTQTMVPYTEVPLTMVSALGTPITQNPFDVAIVNGKLRLYFLPDQHNSTLYVYEAVQNSPYEY